MSWSGDWHHYKFDSDQLLLASLRVFGKEGEKIVSRGYRWNAKVRIVGVVKLDENIQKILTCSNFRLGIVGCSRCHHPCSSIR